VLPDLHRDPAALRAAALIIGGVLPVLRVPGLDPGDLVAMARGPGGAALVAEHDRIVAATGCIGRELADVVVALRVAADGAERADRDAAGSVAAVSPTVGSP